MQSQGAEERCVLTAIGFKWTTECLLCAMTVVEFTIGIYNSGVQCAIYTGVFHTDDVASKF